MNQKNCTPTRKYNVCFPKDVDCPAVCVDRIKNPVTPAEHGPCSPKCEYHKKIEKMLEPCQMPSPDTWPDPEPGPCDQLPRDPCGFTPPPKPKGPKSLCSEPYAPSPLPEPAMTEEKESSCFKLNPCQGKGEEILDT
ncbi:hypothetical protein EVAR_41545_1 [Eumeta japonica]|uniref:Uncharacterized protein n=1 Tax=Eumeta variegata TaxID=151549 RepID=A0A4C1X6L6_EUMVA|nr:hypothetical protein EVAR_41545_1 [Eumeta japonica]